MNEPLEKHDLIRIEAEVQPETFSALNYMAETFHISIGEAIDQLAKFYGPKPNGIDRETILTELSGILGSEHYRF